MSFFSFGKKTKARKGRHLNLPPKREKQKKAIERSYEKRGVPKKEAKSKAIATVRKEMKRK